MNQRRRRPTGQAPHPADSRRRALVSQALHAREVARILAPHVALFGPGDLGDLFGIRLALTGEAR